jgi:hypothetical protein
MSNKTCEPQNTKVDQFITAFNDVAERKHVRVLRPIPVSLKRGENGYIASFLGASIHTAGRTKSEAVQNLRDLIPVFYQNLSVESPRSLSQEMRRNLALLKKFIGEPIRTEP